jgi:hypothetical protein
MRSALLAIAYPCVVRYLTKKKKPVKAQISDFFYASKDNLQIHKKSRRSKSVLSAIACPCIVKYLTKKKKPANSQISDFFYASKDNLQIHKKSRRSKSVPSAIACACVARFWTEHSQIKKKPANSQISDFFYASKDNL